MTARRPLPKWGESAGVLFRVNFRGPLMKLLILGASTRAAAHSAIRAGCVPLAADLFGDRDLVAIAQTDRVAAEAYPERLFETALIQESEAWLFTGALENCPRLIDHLASRLRLMGIGGAPLRAVRDHFELRELLGKGGFCIPRMAREPRAASTGIPWILKPRQSGGGRGIVTWEGQDFDESSYLQEKIEGENLSAVFIGDGQGATLRGVCEQSIGYAGTPFGYRGSLGPWPVSSNARHRVAELGDFIGRCFQLRGLFGIDFILRGIEPWTIEVNPRYTASLEVLELAYRSSILTEHFETFSGAASLPLPELQASRYVAKEVLFAEKPVRFDDGETGLIATSVRFEVPRLADIPQVGTCFEPGGPIVTVFGEGTTIDLCRLDLDRNRQLARSYLKPLKSEP